MTWHLTTKSIRRQHHLRVPMSCREVLIIARTCHGLNRICVESGMFVTYNVEFRKTDFTFSFFPKQNGICMGRRKRQLVFVGTLSSDSVGIVFLDGCVLCFHPIQRKRTDGTKTLQIRLTQAKDSRHQRPPRRQQQRQPLERRSPTVATKAFEEKNTSRQERTRTTTK